MHSPHELQPRHFRVVSAKEVSLRTISPTLRAEVLLGLQDSARLGRQVPPHVLTSVLKLLDRRRVGSVLEVTPGRDIPTPAVREFIRGACDAVRLACSDPESEASKDVWDMRVFGRDGTVDFTAVAPDWLRAGAKRWALEKVGNVSSRSVTRVVEALAYLSAYLTRRDDGGLMPTALDRRAMTSYLSRLRLLEQRGELSKWIHSRTVKDLRLFLREARQLGLMDEGQPLYGLSGTLGSTTMTRTRSAECVATSGAATCHRS